MESHDSPDQDCRNPETILKSQSKRSSPDLRRNLPNGLAAGQLTGLRGGLKGSTQHWPAVYPPECEIPTFVAAVDSAVKRSRPDPTASSGLGPPSSADIAAIAHSCFRSIRAARDFVDRRSKPAHP